MESEGYGREENHAYLGQLFQPVHCYEVNRERCRMAGYEGYQYPVQCFKADMERMVAGRQDELASFHDTILQQS